MTATHARGSAFTRLTRRLRPAPAPSVLDEMMAIDRREAEATRRDLTAMFPAIPDETAPWAPQPRPDADTLRRVADKLRTLPVPAYHWTTAEDICGLPIFRSTIRARARYWHHGCRCEPGNVAGGVRWLASQYADMGPVAFPWRAAEPVQAVPVQSDDTLTWRAAA